MPTCSLVPGVTETERRRYAGWAISSRRVQRSSGSPVSVSKWTSSGSLGWWFIREIKNRVMFHAAKVHETCHRQCRAGVNGKILKVNDRFVGIQRSENAISSPRYCTSKCSTMHGMHPSIRFFCPLRTCGHSS